MKAEGRPHARECRECEVVMHEARSDGDLQPDGRDSSKLNAGLKKKKEQQNAAVQVQCVR